MDFKDPVYGRRKNHELFILFCFPSNLVALGTKSGVSGCLINNDLRNGFDLYYYQKKASIQREHD